MARIGYGITKKDLPGVVKDVLDKGEEALKSKRLPIPPKVFKNNLPSACWVYRFLNRWPEISSRLPENLSHKRANLTEDGIRSWFSDLDEFLLEEHNIVAEQFLCKNNSARIFNLDESGFPLAGTNGQLKVLTKRGAKNVYKITPDCKEQVTVLCCASASGTLSKPYVIFPGVRPKFNFEGVNPNDFDVGASPNGWISSDCFFGWLANLFFPSVKDKVEFPIIVFMDGHSSHINVAVSEFCSENNIILYCFPPHASHILQPLDVSVFGPLKKHWNESITNFQRQYRGLRMTRCHFFKVFHAAWIKAIGAPENVIKGFRKCGLVPFDACVVDFDRLIKPPTPLKIKNKEPSEEEKIAMIRMFQTLKNNIPNEIHAQFEARWDNGYNISDSTDRGVLWECYKELKKLVDFKGEYKEPSRIVTRPMISDEILNLDNTPITPQRVVQEEDIHSQEMNIEEVSATPTTNNLSFNSWEFSPFRSHLKIADHVLISRQKSKTKRTAPPAISGSEYCKYLKTQQEEKTKNLREKEERKIERMKKRKESQKRGRKRKRAAEEEYSISETSMSDVTLDTESVSDVEDSNIYYENFCNACHGKDRWEKDEEWVGCSGLTCRKWFHKDCISDKLHLMDDYEIEKYVVFCKTCGKK